MKNKRVDTLLQIINIEYMKKLIIFLIPIKRFLYFITRAYLTFKNGLVWLFNSKEHTNFTFLLNNQQVENISFVISKFYENCILLSDRNKEFDSLENILDDIYNCSDSQKYFLEIFIDPVFERGLFFTFLASS